MRHNDHAESSVSALERRVEREKAARKSAEELLEARSKELYDANNALIKTQKKLKSQLAELELERRKIEKIAKTDSLTQLSTRTAFLESLSEQLSSHGHTSAHESQNQVWMVVIRLKKYKRVNALLGQAGADFVLTKTAERVDAFVKNLSGESARFSGSEIAFYCKATLEELEQHLAQLQTILSAIILVGEREHVLDYKIAAAGSDLAGLETDTMRAAADQMLTRAGNGESSLVNIYDLRWHEERILRRKLEKEIRLSAMRKEFIPWYQPILNNRDTTSMSLEALARWPKRDGVIQPYQFIPVANDIGVWQDIDHQLFMRACRQVQPLVKSGLVKDLSINVSPLQLIMPNFISNLQDWLSVSNFPPDHLVLEITEDVLIEDISIIHSQIRHLNDLGIRIAVDDFGTGYSNLRNLIELPIDAVKIDRSLVKDIERDNRATMLISTIVQWARAINVSVVAEGVETETQAILLKALGCNKLQGFYFGKAMSVSQLRTEIPRLLKSVAVSNHEFAA